MSNKNDVCCGSQNETLLSIALEETSIAHILNAEGKKIQKGIAIAKCTDDLICLNSSVQNTIIDIIGLETVLLDKLRLALRCDCGECTPPDCSGTLNICATNCCSGDPICNVVVEIYYNKTQLLATGKTNTYGCYSIGEMQNGEYKIVVYDPNGEKETATICITEKQKHICKNICFNSRSNKKNMEITSDCCGNVQRSAK